jgi:hypothetical protein
MREYGRREVLVANIPYAAMVLLGALTILFAFGFSAWAVGGAALYAAYGLAGPFWIMAFVCPYCAYYGTTGCPCGYGVVAARLVQKGDHDCFAQKFKRHIPVIVPLWLLPVGFGVWAASHAFAWSLVGLVVLFVVNSYVVLPLVSRRHSCTDCPQASDCPWMGSERDRK